MKQQGLSFLCLLYYCFVRRCSRSWSQKRR